ncbi:MAG TPA: glycosyltransferase family 4 protein [Acidiphilium sp.]
MFRGRLDVATRSRIAGWAQDDRHPTQPVALLVLDNGALLDRVIANAPRPDLAAAGIGSGRHGFELSLKDGLPGVGRHLIRVVRERDGAELAASPALIAAPDDFDAEARSGLAALLDGVSGAAAIDSAIAALNDEIGRLAARRPATVSASTGHGTRTRHALVIDMVTPVRGRDAGSNAILSHIESLARLGYAVSFAAADPASGAPPTDIEADWQRVPAIRSVEELLTREAGKFDLVYLHRLDTAARYLPLARAHQPRAKLVYSVADLHHLRLARRALIEREPALLARARLVRASEFAVAGAADAVLTHSRAEAGLLRRALPRQTVIVAPWAVAPTELPRTRRGDAIGFIGHFGHAPNLDAARRLAFSIMPLVRARNPKIECLIAGSAMPEAMRRWSAPGVEILGPVNDAARFFGRLRLTVAPMSFGAGIKGKVLDSLAAGIPCIATPTAIEGIDWPESLASCIAATDKAIAEAIVSLHADPVRRRKAATAGRALIVRDWSDQATDAALARLI